MSPRIEELQEWIQVSFPELIAKIGGGTSISVNRFVDMISNSENKSEDFRIVHETERYVVPLRLIQEYFKDHQRPTATMSLKDEVEHLRKRVAELESEKTFEPPPARPPRPPVVQPTPPPRQEDIPTPVLDRMSAEDIRADLKRDLKEAKPVKKGPGRPPAKKESPESSL